MLKAGNEAGIVVTILSESSHFHLFAIQTNHRSAQHFWICPHTIEHHQQPAIIFSQQVTMCGTLRYMHMTCQSMEVPVEYYRGIEYVRVSALPDEERQIFWQSFDQQKVISILRGDALLNDCILLKDYSRWHEIHVRGKQASLLTGQGEAQASHAA